GKSQLALHLAHSFSPPCKRDFFPILWICAASEEKLEQDICDVASKLGILPKGTSPSERGIRAKMELMSWLTTTDLRWMVIFDNVGSFCDLDGCWPPNRPGCATVVTSRDRAIGGTAISRRHRVDPLDVRWTADLILSIIGEVSSTDPENVAAAEEIANELGGLPLAVTQIASYILENTVGLRSFLPLYRRNWKRIHRSKVNLPDYQDYQDTLTNIWRLSSENLDASTKLMGEMLAFLQPDRIPVRFFGGICDEVVADRPRLKFLQDEFEFIDSKKSLEKLALVQSNKDTGDMKIHRLIQLVVLDDMEKAARDERFEDIVRLVKRAFPRITSATVPNSYKSDMWHLAQDCLPHVLSLEGLYLSLKPGITLGKQSGFPQLLSDTSWYLYETGQFGRAAVLLRTAEAVCEGGDAALRASTRSIRALIYHHQNKQNEAKEIWEENLRLRRQLHGEEHFLVGANLCNLGAAHGELGDMAKCRDFFKRGQAHREMYHPDDLSDLALHDCNYSSYLIHNADLADAEKVVQRALARYRQCGETEDGFGYNQLSARA
ncbi:hypothetical protein B0H67DRAFT_657104, partial [Lasiosphaeris hirsuta]